MLGAVAFTERRSTVDEELGTWPLRLSDGRGCGIAGRVRRSAAADRRAGHAGLDLPSGVAARPRGSNRADADVCVRRKPRKAPCSDGSADAPGVAANARRVGFEHHLELWRRPGRPLSPGPTHRWWARFVLRNDGVGREVWLRHRVQVDSLAILIQR